MTLVAGETVLVHAAGSGVGTAAIQVAKAMGASLVLGTAGSADKLEAAAKLGLDVGINYKDEKFADRVAAATRLATKFGADVVLKGAGSVCATPDGTWHINGSGNPGMASAGQGDVLTGLIAALLAQGAESKTALRAGVYLHGAAADHAVAGGAGPAGLTASETIDAARALLNRR